MRIAHTGVELAGRMVGVLIAAGMSTLRLAAPCVG
jgi:hypothetical protein